MSAPTSLPHSNDLSPEYIAYTNAPVLLAQAGTVFAITAAIVLLRFYVRAALIRSFGYDDWAMFIALVYLLYTSIGLLAYSRF